MRALVDIGAADVMWFLGGAGSPCSIRWFDKVPPVGISVWYLSSGAKRTEGPQYIPEQSSPRTSADGLRGPSLRRLCFARGLLRGAGAEEAQDYAGGTPGYLTRCFHRWIV